MLKHALANFGSPSVFVVGADGRRRGGRAATRRRAHGWLGALLLAGVAVLNGCVANSLCAKKQECNPDLQDDSAAVCVEEFNGNIDVLRANKEADCQQLADASLALSGCKASLDCDDFEESDLGGKCDDELDDYNDALNDVGAECFSLD